MFGQRPLPTSGFRTELTPQAQPGDASCLDFAEQRSLSERPLPSSFSPDPKVCGSPAPRSLVASFLNVGGSAFASYCLGPGAGQAGFISDGGPPWRLVDQTCRAVSDLGAPFMICVLAHGPRDYLAGRAGRPDVTRIDRSPHALGTVADVPSAPTRDRVCPGGQPPQPMVQQATGARPLRGASVALLLWACPVMKCTCVCCLRESIDVLCVCPIAACCVDSCAALRRRGALVAMWLRSNFHSARDSPVAKLPSSWLP